MSCHYCLNIEPFVNNKGITTEQNSHLGFLTLGMSSLPADEMPVDSPFYFENVPFIFCRADNYYDNIELTGQTIKFDMTKANHVHFLGLSVNGHFSQEIDFINNSDILYSDRLFFTNFFSEQPVFDDRCAIKFKNIVKSSGEKLGNWKPSMWYFDFRLPRQLDINAIRFKDNPDMHIFAITFSKD